MVIIILLDSTAKQFFVSPRSSSTERNNKAMNTKKNSIEFLLKFIDQSQKISSKNVNKNSLNSQRPVLSKQKGVNTSFCYSSQTKKDSCRVFSPIRQRAGKISQVNPLKKTNPSIKTQEQANITEFIKNQAIGKGTTRNNDSLELDLPSRKKGLVRQNKLILNGIESKCSGVQF